MSEPQIDNVYLDQVREQQEKVDYELKRHRAPAKKQAVKFSLAGSPAQPPGDGGMSLWVGRLTIESPASGAGVP